MQQRPGAGALADERDTEHEARETANQVALGGPASVRHRAAPGTLQKQASDELPTKTSGISEAELLELADKSPVTIEGKALHQYDNVFRAAHNGFIDIAKPEEFERQLRFRIANGSTEYAGSWTNEESFEYEQASPENQVALSNSKWAAHVQQTYLKYLDGKAAEWEHATRIMDAAATLGKLIAGGAMLPPALMIGGGTLAVAGAAEEGLGALALRLVPRLAIWGSQNPLLASSLAGTTVTVAANHLGTDHAPTLQDAKEVSFDLAWGFLDAVQASHFDSGMMSSASPKPTRGGPPETPVTPPPSLAPIEDPPHLAAAAASRPAVETEGSSAGSGPLLQNDDPKNVIRPEASLWKAGPKAPIKPTPGNTAEDREISDINRFAAQTKSAVTPSNDAGTASQQQPQQKPVQVVSTGTGRAIVVSLEEPPSGGSALNTSASTKTKGSGSTELTSGSVTSSAPTGRQRASNTPTGKLPGGGIRRQRRQGRSESRIREKGRSFR